MADLRRIVSTVVIVSFSIAALLGIIALLSGGDFGETEGRVLLTTVIVGVESVALLCYLAAVGKPFVGVAYVGAPVSLLAAGIALYLTWGGNDGGEDDFFDLLEAFGVLVTIAASLAQACLLLALTARHRMTAVLMGTLAAITVVAVMVIVQITGGSSDNDGFWRILGVAGILDVLGTVVLTATAAFRRGAPETPGLSAQSQQRLAAAALAKGTSQDQLLNDALDAYLA